MSLCLETRNTAHELRAAAAVVGAPPIDPADVPRQGPFYTLEGSSAFKQHVAKLEQTILTKDLGRQFFQHMDSTVKRPIKIVQSFENRFSAVENTLYLKVGNDGFDICRDLEGRVVATKESDLIVFLHELTHAEHFHRLGHLYRGESNFPESFPNVEEEITVLGAIAPVFETPIEQIFCENSFRKEYGFLPKCKYWGLAKPTPSNKEFLLSCVQHDVDRTVENLLAFSPDLQKIKDPQSGLYAIDLAIKSRSHKSIRILQKLAQQMTKPSSGAGPRTFVARQVRFTQDY